MDLAILHKIFNNCLWSVESDEDNLFVKKLNKQHFSQGFIKESIDRYEEEIKDLAISLDEDSNPFDFNFEIAQMVADDLAKSRLGRYEEFKGTVFKIDLEI